MKKKKRKINANANANVKAWEINEKPPDRNIWLMDTILIAMFIEHVYFIFIWFAENVRLNKKNCLNRLWNIQSVS